jgi:anti-anti-sigma regulatory factor
MESEAEMVEEWIRLGASRLSWGIGHGPGAVIATLVGTSDDAALGTILEGGLRLVDAAAAVVVLDMRQLAGVEAGGASALVRVAREVQRLDKELRLVGCGEKLGQALRVAGLRGDFWHYPSLAAATEGLVSEPGHAVTVYLRRSRATRARLRLLVASLARPCGMDENDQARMIVALDDVCALAANSSLGDEEPMTLSFFAWANTLTADVGWQVPPALLGDLEEIWARRPSARARVMASVDEVETLRQTEGVVIRLVRHTSGKPVAAAPEEGRRPLLLPDAAARRVAPVDSSAVSLPRRARRFAWKEWALRPRFAFGVGLGGRSAGLGKGVTGDIDNGEGS